MGISRRKFLWGMAVAVGGALVLKPADMWAAMASPEPVAGLQAAGASPVLDLRSNTKAGARNDPAPGIGLFQADGQLWADRWVWQDLGHTMGWKAPSALSIDAVSLGVDPLARLRASQRNALADVLDLDRSLLPDSNLADILAHHILADRADPTGQNRVKPLRISRRRGLRLRLGGFGVVLQEPFSESHPNFASTLAVRRADYRRTASLPDRLTGAAKDLWRRNLRTLQERRDGVELSEEEARSRWQAVLERWTGHDMLQLYGRRGDDLLTALVPQEYLIRGHSHRQPATIIGDTFTDTDGTALGSHTATGSNGGFSWSEVVGTSGHMEIDGSNQVTIPNGEGGERRDARAESNLSGDDQRVELSLVGDGGSSFRFLGPAARFSGDADGAQDFYFGVVRPNEGDVIIIKVVNDSESNISSNAFTANAPHDQKLEVDGSDLELFVDDSSEVTTTDSSITGNLKTGITAFRDAMTGDDFQGQDLGAEEETAQNARAFWW